MICVGMTKIFIYVPTYLNNNLLLVIILVIKKHFNALTFTIIQE